MCLISWHISDFIRKYPPIHCAIIELDAGLLQIQRQVTKQTIDHWLDYKHVH